MYIKKKVIEPYRQNEKPLLVAVGLQGYLGLSQDSKRWKTLDLSDGIHLTSITWRDDLKKYLAVGTESDNGIAMMSSDGENWDTFVTTSSNPARVIWNKSLNEFITVGENGIIETSRTGRSWSRCLTSTHSTLNSIIWNESLHQYIVVGSEGIILSSDNGITWQIESSKLTDNLTSIAWNDVLKKYIVVTTTKQLFLTSSNGKEWWPSEDSTLDQPMYDITWSSSLDKFVSGGLFHTICSTRGGEIWEKQSFTSGGVRRYLISNIIWSTHFSAYFAVDLSGFLYSSVNGISWNSTLLDGDISGNGRGITGICEGVLVI